METKKLQALKYFLENDMKIKETLIKLAPSEIDDFDDTSRMDYVNKLYKGLKSLESRFLLSIKKFEFDSEVESAIEEHFKKAREAFCIGKYEHGICQELYASQFSTMEMEFIEQVKKECVGYTMNETSNLVELIQRAKTMNELLHVVHSYVVNNEEILQSMPVIGQKENTMGEPITLYGEENEVAKNIFNKFPLEMDCGITDIISLQNKVLMMVRDRGHALTIDMDISKQDGVEVRYFVPKLCNRIMIEELPGINKNGISQSGATGFFVSSEDKISERIFDFIEKVPTDGDMIIEPIFNKEDAKEIAMQQGENGVKISKIEWIKTKFIELKEKMNNKNIGKREEKDNDRDM